MSKYIVSTSELLITLKMGASLDQEKVDTTITIKYFINKKVK